MSSKRDLEDLAKEADDVCKALLVMLFSVIALKAIHYLTWCCWLQYVPYVPVRLRKEARLEKREEQRRYREPSPPAQPDAPKAGPRAKVSLLDQASELQKEAKGKFEVRVVDLSWSHSSRGVGGHLHSIPRVRVGETGQAGG